MKGEDEKVSEFENMVHEFLERDDVKDGGPDFFKRLKTVLSKEINSVKKGPPIDEEDHMTFDEAIESSVKFIKERYSSKKEETSLEWVKYHLYQHEKRFLKLELLSGTPDDKPVTTWKGFMEALQSTGRIKLITKGKETLAKPS